MLQQRLTLFIICLFASYCLAAAQEVISPYGLTMNMLPNTEQVFLNGYPVNTPLEKAVTFRENWQFTDISTTRPVFGWILPSGNELLDYATDVLTSRNVPVALPTPSRK